MTESSRATLAQLLTRLITAGQRITISEVTPQGDADEFNVALIRAGEALASRAGDAPPEGPWQVEREDTKTTRGDPVVTWWVWRAPSWYLAQLDTEEQATAVRDALNQVARAASPVPKTESK